MLSNGDVLRAINDHREECTDNLGRVYVSWRKVVILFSSTVLLLGTTIAGAAVFISDIKGDVRVERKRNDTQDAQIGRFERMSRDVQWIRRHLEK